jgi:hypothetical protein
MTNKEAPFSYIEESAERVERLLSKCKLLFLYTFLLKSEDSLNRLQQCNLMKFPKMSVKMNGLDFRQPRSTGQKKDLKTTYQQAGLETSRSFLLDRPLPMRSELSPQRVMRWKLKEYQLAYRRLKNLKKQIELETLKPHQITQLNQSKQSKEKKQDESKELWKELVKTSEERHFQVNRIIKYLTDI